MVVCSVVCIILLGLGLWLLLFRQRRLTATTTAVVTEYAPCDRNFSAVCSVTYRVVVPPTTATEARTKTETVGSDRQFTTGQTVQAWYDPSRDPFDTVTIAENDDYSTLGTVLVVLALVVVFFVCVWWYLTRRYKAFGGGHHREPRSSLTNPTWDVHRSAKKK